MLDGVCVGVCVGVDVWVGVSVGVLDGVLVGVSVEVGVLVGVLVLVTVGVAVGVDVGVGVGVVPLKEAATSVEEPFVRLHSAAIRYPPPESRDEESFRGEPVELAVVGLDHVEYGLLASVYFTAPLSMNHDTKLFVAV